MNPLITVVVPVFGGRETTRRCLESVRLHAATSATPCSVLIIDDDTPDAGIRADLEQFALDSDPGFVTVLTNPVNLGFVASVNRGMRAATGDVVLLNSDTVVTEGWLDRMCAVASSSPSVGTVTPLTNAGSICTLPAEVIAHFDLDGSAPQIEACGRFVEQHGLGAHPCVISGVGFCMLITRAALDATGLFDEETFGRGYGEEVDFCLRASRIGFEHRVDDRTFVYHAEGTSFGRERVARMEQAKGLVRERHPSFAEQNRRERAADPLGVTFASLQLALHPRQPGRPQVLHILHRPSDPPGGTERHVEALMEGVQQDFDSAVLSPVEAGVLLRTRYLTAEGEVVSDEHLLPGAPGSVRMVGAGSGEPDGDAALSLAVALYDFDVVHIHNLLGHSPATLATAAAFPGPVVYTLHDLYLACPNHSLLYRDVRACGIPEDLAVCASCLPSSKVDATVDDLVAFRGAMTRDLAGIDRFVVADITAADYLRRVHRVPEEAVSVIEHGTLIDSVVNAPLESSRIMEDPLRVAFVGRGWRKKGLEVVNHVAGDLAASSIELHHFGPARDAIDPSVRVHGAYDNDDLPALLIEAGIHIVLLPGPYAETYSYVMSEAMVTGLPVIGAGYGALGHRIRQHSVGWTIDPDDPSTLTTLLVNLDRCRPELLRATNNARQLAIEPAAVSARHHVALYRDAMANASRASTGGATNTTTTTDDDLRRHLLALSAQNAQLLAKVGPPPAMSTSRRLLARARASLKHRAPRVHAAVVAVAHALTTGRRFATAAWSGATRRATKG